MYNVDQMVKIGRGHFRKWLELHLFLPFLVKFVCYFGLFDIAG